MTNIEKFLDLVSTKKARVGIIGLGYVGLPLMLTFIRKGFRVIGFDVDATKIDDLTHGRSYIKHVNSESVKEAMEARMFLATSDFAWIHDSCDAVIICVPTPLNKNREPDMQYIEQTVNRIRPPRKGQLIVLESTTYPGTTDEFICERLEAEGAIAGKDFFLAFSPEREDPGNKKYNTQSIPKIVGGHTPDCTKAATALYAAVLDRVVPVSGTRVAEMTKLLENSFRSVNIALVNELKMLCDAMGIDVWEVIRAAATKPFGFMAFYPGPGLGGHCIPVDPFYLTWKAREFDMTTRFIELAGEINTSMHHYVLDKVIYALNLHSKSVRGSKLLILGVAYKKDIDDMRESPALPIMEMLLDLGGNVSFYDSFVPKLVPMRDYDLKKRFGDNFNDESLMDPHNVQDYDLVVVVTDHSTVDYGKLVQDASLVVDCRNVTKDICEPSLRAKVIKA